MCIVLYVVELDRVFFVGWLVDSFVHSFVRLQFGYVKPNVWSFIVCSSTWFTVVFHGTLLFDVFCVNDLIVESFFFFSILRFYSLVFDWYCFSYYYCYYFNKSGIYFGWRKRMKRWLFFLNVRNLLFLVLLSEFAVSVNMCNVCGLHTRQFICIWKGEECNAF